MHLILSARNRLFGAFCVAALLGAQQYECPYEKPLDPAKAIGLLQDSKESWQLEQAAISLVMAKDAAQLDKLGSFLRDPAFLARLDPDYRYGYNLRVRRVVSAIGKLGTPKAENLLLNLAQDKTFASNHERLGAVIDAASSIQQPSSKMLDYLDKLAPPGSGYQNRVVAALARMRNPEACALIEKRLLSPDHRSSKKQGWLITWLSSVRNDPAIVAMYGRLLRADVPDRELRNILVQTLFDFRPTEWYGPNSLYVPPPKRNEASSEVLREVLALADVALKLDVSDDTKEGVRKARKEIEAILAERDKK